MDTPASPSTAETPAGAQRPSDFSWVWQVTVLSLVLGVMLALALRTTAHIRSIGLPDRGFTDLAAIRKENAKLQLEQQGLDKEVQAFSNSVNSERDSGKALRQQLVEYRALTGYAPVQGPGIEIVLRDSPQPMLPGTESLRDAYLLNIERDVKGVVNELWAAGAEAIAVAGKDGQFERFIVTTTITAGPGRSAVVNGKTLALPLTLRVIGNPKELRGALEMNEGILLKTGLRELRMIDIKEKQQLELPAYANTGVAGSAPESREATANR